MNKIPFITHLPLHLKGSVFRDPIFAGSENRIVWTHSKWPSDTRIRKFEKTDGNRTCSIFIRRSSEKMKGAGIFCMVSLWSFWRQIEDSLLARKVWTHYKWPYDILNTKTEPWNRTIWTPASNFRNQELEPKNRIVWMGLKDVRAPCYCASTEILCAQFSLILLSGAVFYLEARFYCEAVT